MNFDGMWTEPDTDPREALEPGSGEKAVLSEYLDRYRMTLELKCQGLTAEGQIELLRLYRTEEDPDLDFNQAVADDEVVADAWDTWRREVAHARAVYADLDLDAPVDVHGKEVETRHIVVHLVEEYARHAGHADLLRECIDGRTGQ